MKYQIYLEWILINVYIRVMKEGNKMKSSINSVDFKEVIEENKKNIQI